MTQGFSERPATEKTLRSLVSGIVATFAGGVKRAWNLTADKDNVFVIGNVAVTNLGNLVGTWGYRSGSSGTPSALPANARVIGIAAYATAAGTVTINGGDPIPLPDGVQISISPVAQLVSPTLLFSGTSSYFVEFLT